MLIIIYSVLFFTLLVVYDSLPRNSKKLYDACFTFLEYSFFTSFLWYCIKSKGFKRLMLFLSILFVIFQISYYFSTKEVVKLDSIPIGIETIVIFIYIIFFLFEQFKIEKANYIYSNPGFLLAIGIMIYLGGTFFFNILVNHMDSSDIVKYIQYTFIADIIKNLFFAFALTVFIKDSRKRVHQTKSIPYLDMI